ncbi:MAG: AIR synthase-related protein, partial [Methanobacteriaceae archaeon]
IIGDTFDEVEGSEYHRTIHNIEEGNAPKIRIDDEIESANTVLNIIDKFKDGITAIHDCSAGGIAIALGEMALSGEIGAKIDISTIPSQILCSDVETKNELLSKILFSESHGRYIITVKPDILEDVLAECGAIASCIGEVNGDSLEFTKLGGCSCGGGMEGFKISISELKNSYTGTIEEYMA